ncbi:fungal-specific transcription factor domain-containing protein [Hypoxylon sp. NC1633]|nr:fungal-specific transcription factor domain-containing protein [Hypoxylon sp. NC1633]
MDGHGPAPFRSGLQTTKTCVECMRRKIKCNGNLPCDKCVYYQVPSCQYRRRKQRKLPALSPVAEAAAKGQSAAEAIVAKLFPGWDPASLVDLPTQELVELARDALSAQYSSPSDSSDQPVLGGPTATQREESDEERGWQEFLLQGDEVCDDVNGLSLNVHRRSYLGASSIHAVFRVMFHVKPSLQWELQSSIIPKDAVIAQNAVATSSLWTRSNQNAPPALEEETAINAYFAHIHGIVPLLDEPYFREVWRRGQRCDRPWLALLNMILVLGSLAVGDDESSGIYYARAQAYLDLELLGTGCLESLQALCLLGGLYLHYKNSPNMAYAIMGLAYRMAVGLGLHLQPARLTPGNNRAQEASGGNWRPQIRRQIWWSLFCLDTWGSMTLGRPTLGRWDPKTMTVQPVVVASNMDGKAPSSAVALSLDSARAFCLIATKVQHRLAQFSPMSVAEIAIFDAEVQRWYQGLPPMLFHLDRCPASLLSAQYIMRNRYFNLRLLLFRSVLLRYAHAKVPLDSLSPGDREAVRMCRDIACEAIDQVFSSRHSLNKILVCSAVWYLYQASMVLLLSIMVDLDHFENPKWRAAVERALSLLSDAIPWSRAAVRSKRVVESLFRVSTTTATTPSSVPDIDDLGGLPGDPLWNLLGLDTFTDEGWTGHASEGIDWAEMHYNRFGP